MRETNDLTLKNDEFDRFFPEPPPSIKRRVLGRRREVRKRLITAALCLSLILGGLFFYRVSTKATAEPQLSSYSYYYTYALGEEVFLLGAK
jgi:hypothetical protein